MHFTGFSEKDRSNLEADRMTGSGDMQTTDRPTEILCFGKIFSQMPLMAFG